MDARLSRLLSVFAVLCLWCHGLSAAAAATYPTPNFVVHAPTPEAAKSIALAAEHYRKELAIEWLGHALPRWSQPCPIKVKIGQIGAGGATTFTFHPAANGSAEVCGWDMQIQGSLERILDSVLPHEVSHTIFACHFRRPLPRWADEGAATLVEHDSERRRQILTVRQVLNTRRRIPLKQLLAIKEYPKDMQDVLTLYAEGYTLAELLVQQGGKARYLKFLADAHAQGWDRAIVTNYEYQGVDDLEQGWRDWIVAGCPQLPLPGGQLLADAGKQTRPVSNEVVIRGQSPAVDPFLTVSSAHDETPRIARDASPGRARENARASDAAAAAEELEPRLVALVPSRVRIAEEADELEAPAPARGQFIAPPRRQLPAAALTRSVDAPTSDEPPRTRRQATWSEFPHEPRPSPFTRLEAR